MGRKGKGEIQKDVAVKEIQNKRFHEKVKESEKKRYKREKNTLSFREIQEILQEEEEIFSEPLYFQ